MVWIVESLGRKSRHLQLVICGTTRPRCFDEGTDVSDGMVIVEVSNHAGSIDWIQEVCSTNKSTTSCGQCIRQAEASELWHQQSGFLELVHKFLHDGLHL